MAFVLNEEKVRVTWRYSDDKTQIIANDPIAREKRLKVTGTRFGAALGLNKWSTPFQMWCEISKVAKKPFVGNDATNAGVIIEVKQQRWARENLSPTIHSPEMYYGEKLDEVKYDFFKHHPVFGGMWDAIDVVDGNITNVIEFKTTKRPDDWLIEPPIYYQVQVLLYAYLLGVKECTLVCSFVDESDYIDPYAYVVNESNTRVWNLNTDTTLIEFEGERLTITELVEHVLYWYETYVDSGISPIFDPNKDKDYLDIMRTTYLPMATELDELLAQRASYQAEIDTVLEVSGIGKMQEDLKVLNNEIKRKLAESLTNEQNKVVYKDVYINRVEKLIPDVDKLKADGLFDQYSKVSTSITLKAKKEG